MPSHAWYAARASKKLAAHQAALPPEQRIINRTDWDDVIQKRVSVQTKRARQSSKRIFISIASDPSVGICESREEAEAYFQEDGPPFTTSVLRKFVESAAICSQGYIIQDIPSARSCKAQVIYLFGAAMAAGNPVERAVQDNVLLWVDGPMVTKGLAHEIAREKPTPIPEDITAFLRNLFDPKFIVSLGSTRTVLLIALFVCLQVDCSGRVSEFLMPHLSKEDTAAYIKEHRDKMFTWGCVEIFAFKDQDTDHVFLQARLTFRDIKNPGVHNKYRHKKTVPLRLLPPAFIAEDTLFWLVVLGLIDGIFAGVSSWSDIDQLQPGPHGQSIPIKPSKLEVPVFRAANAYPSSQDDLIRKDQMDAQAMGAYLHKLSRFCGLLHSMLPNVLRRGSAYLLANTVSKEERSARMGHTEESSTYWDNYRNTTSTVDFQGRRHGIEDEDVARMSSVFLNTGNKRPPTRVSEEGMAEINQDEELMALLSEQSKAIDELLGKFRTLKIAKEQDPERHIAWVRVRDRGIKRMHHLQEKKFKEEYKAFLEGTMNPSRNAHQDSVEVPALVLGRSENDTLLDQQEQEVLDDKMLTEPQLLQQEAEAAEALDMLNTDLCIDEVADGDDLLDVVQDDKDEDGHQEEQQVGASSKPKGVVTSARSFAFREISGRSLVDHVPTWLYDQPQGTTRAELSAIFVDAFNHLHPADRFYPNQHPFPGTYVCRFCGLDFVGEERVQVHAHFCEGELLARDTLDRLRAGDALAVDTCPLMQTKTDATTPQPCWFKLQGAVAPYIGHCRNIHREQVGSEELNVCRAHGGAPLAFGSLQDFRIHIVTAHNAPTTTLKYQRPTGGMAVEEMLFFCPFCQVWIPRTEVLEETHLATHFDDAAATISAHGLSGTYTAFLWAHPSFCPFCLYDIKLNVVTRFYQFSDPRQLLAHISGHLSDKKGTMTCPAAVATPEGLPQCTSTESFDADSLAAHLSEAHGLEVKMPKKVPGKNGRAKTAPVEEEPSSEEARPKKKNKTKASARKTSAKKASVVVISSDSEMEVWSDSEDAQPLQTRKAPARKASARKAAGNNGYVESSDSDDVHAKATAADRRPLGKKDPNRRAK